MEGYAWDSSDIRKTTYVYLPYGYDENSSSITEFRAFHNEFEKDMMPAVDLYNALPLFFTEG